MKQRHFSHSRARYNPLAFILILLAITLAFVGYWRANVFPRAAEVPSVTITNQATLRYCGENEGLDTCNPNAGLYSGRSQSNSVSNNVSGPTPPPTPTPTPTPTPPTEEGKFCATIKLNNRASYDHSSILIEITNEQTQKVIATLPQASSTADGTITITATDFLANLNNTTPFSIKIMPKGYLARKLTGQTNLTSQCVTFSDNKKFIEGDFNGDNTINLIDLAKAVFARNGGNDPGAQAVYSQKGGHPDLPDLARLVYNYNNYRTGE